ncbi:hypothetical protein BCR44DRAFT_1217065 [Catenaria anguillulae PL171]|uniref:Uncharacterized protein n=1 Tax=Catenaria anguillulae PL171 TaxID=765915 RepID=A0A1Y2I3A4_9FUNG|nr:hypothetical protein BCR44DRAFT_1217065 [Catenaria anguillulae PL171]
MSNGPSGGGTITRNAALKKKVQRLLQSHLEAKRRLLDLDEATAERTLSIAELQSKVNGITSQLELNGSTHLLSPSDHLSLESSLQGYRDSLLHLAQAESQTRETRAHLSSNWPILAIVFRQSRTKSIRASCRSWMQSTVGFCSLIMQRYSTTWILKALLLSQRGSSSTRTRRFIAIEPNATRASAG